MKKKLKLWEYSYEILTKNSHRYAGCKGKGTSNSISHKEIVSVVKVISLLGNMSNFRLRYVSSEYLKDLININFIICDVGKSREKLVIVLGIRKELSS